MSDFLPRANALIDSSKLSLQEKLLAICKLINEVDPKYSWVGFYFMEDETKKLHLGPYVGEKTEHEVIPYGKGICGQVADTGKTYLADNVDQESNYIACSANVRSEIVIPIYDAEILVAQLDIDSSELEAFSTEEREMLEELCFSIGAQLGPDMHYEDFFSTNE